MIGHNGYSFDDVVAENLERGLYWAQRDCLIRAIRDPGLSHRHRIVVAEIIAMTNAESGVAYPGRKHLADVTGYTEAGIAKTISELVDRGYVVSARRSPEPGRRPLAHYTIVKPTAEELRAAIDAHIEAIRAGNVTPVGNIRWGGNVTPGRNVTTSGNVTPVGNVTDATKEKGEQNQYQVSNVTPVGNVTPVVPTVTSIDNINTISPSGERGVGREASSAPPAKSDARGARLDASDQEFVRKCGTWALENFEITRQQAFAEWQAFSDFWCAKAGKDARKLDWFATWRNWVRNSRKGYRPRKSALPPEIKQPSKPVTAPVDGWETRGGDM